MVLSFRQALFGVGAFLILFGGAFALMTSAAAGAQQGFFEALSSGFTSAFFALFSGVLMGVGSTLFIVGMLIGIKGNPAHITGAFIFSILSMLLAVSAVANPEQTTFPMLVVFFAGMAASGAFLLSAVVFALSGAMKSYLYGKKK